MAANGGAYYTRSVRPLCSRREEPPRVAAVALLFTALVFATNARGQFRIIDDPRSEAGARFGYALAAVGSDFAVGAPGAQVFGRDGAGRVQLFAVNGALRQTFEALTPVAGAALGTAVVASEGRVFGGAPGDQPIGVSGVGAVYVFDASTGRVLLVIGSPDPDATTVPIGGTIPGGGLPRDTGSRPIPEGFGRALAVAGDLLAVGAPDSIVDDLDGAGAVYVFRLDGVLLRTLEDPTPRAHAFFGASVALIGDALVVGAPGSPDGGVDRAGRVLVFDATSGALRRTLSAPISTSGAEFGAVVGAIEDALFVSAPRDRANGAGAVYLFSFPTTAFLKVITPPTSSPDLDFGRAVVAAGSNLLVGAAGPGRDQSGEAFLIEPLTSATLSDFTPTTPRAGGRFGFALAAEDRVFAIGEPAFDAPGAIGRVYLFGEAPAPSGAGARQPPRPFEPPPPTPRCPQGASTVSLDCRLAVLLPTARDAGLPGLAPPLRRAGRNLRRAETAPGPRRARALRRAIRDVGQFTSRLQSGRGLAAVSAEVRAALVAEVGLVSADMASLLANTGH
jgi:hypothetical protein